MNPQVCPLILISWHMRANLINCLSSCVQNGFFHNVAAIFNICIVSIQLGFAGQLHLTTESNMMSSFISLATLCYFKCSLIQLWPLSTHVHTLVCMVCLYVLIVCMYVYTYLCIYVCMYVYMYILLYAWYVCMY